jgi:anti-anti-sigma factor
MRTASRSPLDLTVVCIGARWRVLVRGELDLRSGAELLGVADVLAAARVSRVDLDLTGVTFVDTAGWHSVVAAQQRIEQSGAVAEVSRRSPAVERLVRLLHRSELSATAG